MKHRTKKVISYIVTLLVIAAATLWVCSKFVHLGDVEFTDNAQVKQQIVPVNSRVQGYIKEIRFNEYEPVKKGDTLMIIDDADMRLRVAQARADYQNAQAGFRVWHTLTKVPKCLQSVPSEAPSVSRRNAITIGAKY
ncbi:biotin/lipoyl-binding protein [uncultured Duncaniella sp.]|uniref:biotin/lipoyl-binding protein n=1 Tax=uncultured Duncaniella sp. TaxID=2768039 RepID=UPI00351FBD5E